MASLLDIGPLTEEVEIHGTKLTVQGLTAGHIFQLFAEFPDMRKLFDMAGNDSPQAVMLALAPDLIARIIAVATGSPGDKAVEAKAKTLGATEQLAILAAVQRMTFKDGLGPFIDRVSGLMGGVMQQMSIPEQPSVAPVTRLRSRSNASLQTDTPNLAHGRAPRVN